MRGHSEPPDGGALRLEVRSADSPKISPCSFSESPDEAWMQLALQLAARGLGRTTPNPPVGCVLVKNGVAVGKGYHAKAGGPHAEVLALREAGVSAKGATAYVTLEPCSHHGRTPPCVNALVAAGVQRIVIAALDPNPLVAGAGLTHLREAGLDVLWGVLERGAVRQQAGFRSLVGRGRPWVVYKAAMTLDGKVAAVSGASRWVSSGAARALVHRWRDELDAVAVGSGTVLADDPHLGTRDVPGGRDARPVIFDRRARSPLTARVIRPGSTLVTSRTAQTAAFERTGVTVVRADSEGEALAALGQLGLSTVLLEGGPTLAGALLGADLIDEVRFFVAPKLLGAGLTPLSAPFAVSMAEARSLQDVQVESVGQDVLIRGYLREIPRLEADAFRAYSA